MSDNEKYCVSYDVSNLTYYEKGRLLDELKDINHIHDVDLKGTDISLCVRDTEKFKDVEAELGKRATNYTTLSDDLKSLYIFIQDASGDDIEIIN